MAPHQLLYLIYGKDTPFLEGRFSILSAFAAAKDAQPNITVMTDRPEAFSKFPVNIVRLDAPTLKAWRGPHDFIHRTKICALLAWLEQVEKAVLIDADTLFLQSPSRLFERISPGNALMHQDEGLVFAKLPHRLVADGLRAHFPNGTVALASGETYTMRAEPRMWNSGVVGVHQEDRSKVQTALELTDAMCAHIHAHTIEQFAFGLVFDERMKLSPAYNLVEHYWAAQPYPCRPVWKPQREMHHDQAKAFFERHAGASFEEMVQAMRRRPPQLFRIGRKVRLMAAVRRRALKQPSPVQFVLRQLGFCDAV